MTSVTDNRKVEPGVFEEAKNRCLERLKTDPLALIPINMGCTAIGIKDPLQVAAEFVPDKEDVAIIIVSIIGCVPVVGPLLQGAFTIFWRRASPSDSVSKEELNKAINQLRDEIMGVIKEKIQQSEIGMWKSIIQSLLDGLSESCGILNDNFTKLKYKLLKGEDISDDFTDDLRNKIDILNDKVLSLIAFCNNDKFFIHVAPYLLQALFVYVLLIRTIESYWYQFEIDEIHVVGRPEDKELGLDAIPSYRELLHNTIIKNINKLSERFVNGSPKEFGNLHQLLKSDIISYPVPLIVYDKEDVPGLGMTPFIQVPKREGSFIFRFDACNMQPNPTFADIRGGSAVPPRELVTGCRGVYLEYQPRCFVRTNGRPFRLRVFAELGYDMFHGGGDKEALKRIRLNEYLELKLQESIGFIHEPEEFNQLTNSKCQHGSVSGFYMSETLMHDGELIFDTLNPMRDMFYKSQNGIVGIINCVELIFK